ncbi:hypothetical protein M427DRAFT_326256 [Gonapodya prolifera JEL478]|uniref:EGF-like domain-containing protein n=1 Tax=Gonapodya prolifera (strain JEL478) TaxID=1344416 RepID=A0A139AEG7_GONPJ|nr:hypothetical protein M427DRAFT_326256 [Gonapodya prolifera JEL478]|eukprot:KXS15216.1 hypothetical protein M427DRAFT_326256 [Gonapodya prolifera JEL478]
MLKIPILAWFDLVLLFSAFSIATAQSDNLPTVAEIQGTKHHLARRDCPWGTQVWPSDTTGQCTCKTGWTKGGNGQCCSPNSYWDSSRGCVCNAGTSWNGNT